MKKCILKLLIVLTVAILTTKVWADLASDLRQYGTSIVCSDNYFFKSLLKADITLAKAKGNHFVSDIHLKATKLELQNYLQECPLNIEYSQLQVFSEKIEEMIMSGYWRVRYIEEDYSVRHNYEHQRTYYSASSKTLMRNIDDYFSELLAPYKFDRSSINHQ